MAQDLASDFNSEKDTDSIRGIFDFYDAFDRGYITHQQLRYDHYNACHMVMWCRSCDVWTYVDIQDIRERNRSMSLIIRDLETGSDQPAYSGDHNLWSIVASHQNNPISTLATLNRTLLLSKKYPGWRLTFRTALKMGEALNETEIAELIENVDPRKSGKIMYEPFCAYILSK